MARGTSAWRETVARWLDRRLLGGAMAAAEARAVRADDRLRDALEALPEGVVFLDAEGRYILWNSRYAQIYHGSADLFEPGRKLADTLRIGVYRGDYPDAVGREEAWLAERLAMLAKPSGERIEQRLADGRWLMIEERATSDGGVIGLRVDITQLKHQAQALETALNAAEAASRAKSEFLADMSHELKTPLNAVMGLGQALAARLEEPENQALAREVVAGAVTLDQLVNGLLDYDQDVAIAPGPASDTPDADDERPLRVLLADDNATNRKVIELMLSAAGAEVTSVGDGGQAIEAWRGRTFDVALMDLRMPVMDGLEAIRRIRAAEVERQAPRLPIIVLSANASAEDRNASAEAGADRHIAKPIQSRTLFESIVGVMSG